MTFCDLKITLISIISTNPRVFSTLAQIINCRRPVVTIYGDCILVVGSVSSNIGMAFYDNLDLNGLKWSANRLKLAKNSPKERYFYTYVQRVHKCARAYVHKLGVILTSDVCR
jgi:hypothetical protein